MDVYKKIEEAAEYQRKIWQGHDEEDFEKCSGSAPNLYGLLTSSSKEELLEAGSKVRAAFLYSDEAEEHMKDNNPEMEQKFYSLAEEALKKSREIVGLETESVKYKIKWWKAYGHGERDVLFENLVKEHEVQLEDKELAEKCADILLDAMEYHDVKDWESVDEKLEEYFEIYFNSAQLMEKEWI